MTRIFTDGAEMGDNLFLDVVSANWTATANPRSGVYSYFHSGNYAIKYIPDLDESYLRFAYLGSYGTGDLVSYRHSTTTLGSISANVDGKLTAKINAVVVATGSTIWANGSWHLVESYLKIGDNPDGRFIVRLDGIEEINFTGDTKPGADTHYDNLYFYRLTSGNVYFDDFALNDTNGIVDNSWCGDGYVIKATPSGSSATANDWLNSGSVSGSANYLYVDDFPANSTDYVYASASSTGLQTQFTLTNPSIPTGAVVTRIYAEARARKLSANNCGVKLGQLAEGGTDVVSGSRALPSLTDFIRVIGDESKINPVSGSAWTAADLNNLELVLEI